MNVNLNEICKPKEKYEFDAKIYPKYPNILAPQNNTKLVYDLIYDRKKCTISLKNANMMKFLQNCGNFGFEIDHLEDFMEIISNAQFVKCENEGEEENAEELDKTCLQNSKYASKRIKIDPDSLSSTEFSHLYQFFAFEAIFLMHHLNCARVFAGEENTRSEQLNLDEFWEELCGATASSLLPSKLNNYSTSVRHFAALYAVYHFYRELGWIVKLGLRLGVDFLLYPIDQRLAHATHTVKIVLNVGDDCDEEEEDQSVRSWSHSDSLRFCRNANTVRKSLIVCRVTIPNDVSFSTPDCIGCFSINECLIERVPDKREKTWISPYCSFQKTG